MGIKLKYTAGLIIPFIFWGCNGTSPQLPKKGVIVKVVKEAKNRPGSLQCNDKNFVMSYIYVGPDTVKGPVSKNEKWLIATYAKAALKETSYITPVTMKYEPGYDDKIYPIMTINVIKDKIIKRKPRPDIVEKYGVFIAQIDIKVPGSGVVCNSSEPVTVTISYKEPTYKEDFLPSDEDIHQFLVKSAIKKAVSNFVPVTRTILRPVMDGSGVVGESAKMLNADNCEMAKDILKDYLKTHKDDKAYYNLGVSYECLAKSKEVTEVKPLLRKALSAYTEAVKLNPDNYYYNQARKEIKDELRLLHKIKQKAKDIKDYIESYN